MVNRVLVSCLRISRRTSAHSKGRVRLHPCRDGSGRTRQKREFSAVQRVFRNARITGGLAESSLIRYDTVEINMSSKGDGMASLV